MNLIWIMPECPVPANTGGRVGVWNRLVRLCKNNDVWLYLTVDDKKDFESKKELEKICKEVHFYDRSKGISTFVKSVVFPFPAVSRWSSKMRDDVEVCYCENKIDFIMIDFPQMLGNLSKVILKSGKIILNQHNIEYLSMKSLATEIRNPIKRLVYNIVAKQLERYEKKCYNIIPIKLYTFVSLKDKAFFEKKYKKKNTLLVPVGANIKDFQATLGSKDVAFISKLSYPSNASGALWLIKEVWPLLMKEQSDAKLFLVGKDPSEELQELGNEINSVIVTGMVDSIEEYYEKCDVIFVPIFSGGGVKVKLLEALGYGKIVITTTKGLEGTDFKPDVHVLVADTPNEFAKKCIDVFNYPEKYEEMRRRAHNFVTNKYSWDGIVGKFEKELLKLENN